MSLNVFLNVFEITTIHIFIGNMIIALTPLFPREQPLRKVWLMSLDIQNALNKMSPVQNVDFHVQFG